MVQPNIPTAVLRFENLGDPASDWQGRALSEALRQRLGAENLPRAASAAPGISTERLAAIDSGAARIITGTFVTVGDTVDVIAFAENPMTQQVTGPVRAKGLLAAVVQTLASQLGATGAAGFNIASPALREYSAATDTAGAAALAHYERAVAADPGFGPASLGLVRTAMGQNDPARARSALQDAALHAASFTRRDQANLQLLQATLVGDGRGRIEALRALVGLGNAGAELLRTLGDAEMSVRESAQAESHYRQAAALAPGDPNLQNVLAYAALYAGDEAGARAAAGEYRRLRPQDANSFDTQGDVELTFGHLPEAEKVYLASPDLSFQNYSPTWKAARARLLSGDFAGATLLFENHRAALQKAGSPLSGYRAAEWQALTGHRSEAAAAMAGLAAKAILPELRSAEFAQAAIWAAISGDRAHASAWSAAALSPVQATTFLPAALARFLADAPASADVWKRRSETNINGGNPTEARRLAVGFALLLSGSFPEALPVWKQIYDAAPAADPLSASLYGWALLETGHKTEAARLLRPNPLPSANVAPSFEALYLPALLEWRKSSLRQ